MSRPAALYRTLGVPGVLAVACSALALVVVAFGARSFVRGLLTPSGGGQVSSEGENDRARRYALSLESHVKQIDGRSLFFIPSEPSKPPPPAPVKVADAPPPPPPPPAKYGGPAIVGMYGGSIWFDDGKWVKPGETSSGGVKLIRLEAPWSARVEWKGVEFDVPLFERDKIVNKPPAPAAPASAPTTAAADPKPAGDKPTEGAGADAKPTGDAKPVGEGKPGDTPPPAPSADKPETPPPAADRIGAGPPPPESPTQAEGPAPAGEDPRP